LGSKRRKSSITIHKKIKKTLASQGFSLFQVIRHFCLLGRILHPFYCSSGCEIGKQFLAKLGSNFNEIEKNYSCIQVSKQIQSLEN
jgi:hypothetical protein